MEDVEAFRTGPVMENMIMGEILNVVEKLKQPVGQGGRTLSAESIKSQRRSFFSLKGLGTQIIFNVIIRNVQKKRELDQMAGDTSVQLQNTKEKVNDNVDKALLTMVGAVSQLEEMITHDHIPEATLEDLKRLEECKNKMLTDDSMSDSEMMSTRTGT